MGRVLREQDRLGFEIGQQAFAPAFAAKARLLEAAKGDVEIGTESVLADSAGTLSQNVFRFDSALPFGGFKQSGLGREGGKEGLASCTELKAIMLA